MINASEFLDIEKLEALIADGMIVRTKHPELDFFIYNYTHKAQYTLRAPWPNEALHCRGLILDSDFNVVARPFKKFFNLGEHSRSDITFSKTFTVTEKKDGSLGLLYPHPYWDGRHRSIATRGSFTSDQAIRANKILNEKYLEFTEDIDNLELFFVHEDGTWHGVTYLFEIVYPENRIVCNYGDQEDLVLLAAIDTNTGADLPLDIKEWPWPVVKHYDVDCKPRDVLEALDLPQDGSSEGVVLKFDWPKGQHTRIKVKIDEYVRLHRIITGVSNKLVWQYLSEGKDFDELLDRVPDEFNNWLEKTVKDLEDQFGVIIVEAAKEYELIHKRLSDDYTRREFAELAKQTKYPDLMFRMLDMKDIAEPIWKRLKPEFAKAYSVDIDSMG